ncbi:hypothetical protein DUI87_22837 [Hirundo rustica rustica]|uniref:Uncharacterized protein n=1 Tax=Hirundo rustica rustica TaxID=333673 RepID=A0A3M0JGP4_HIRRU|nr:hypothetical protein DUI87_22837 [Hirundo rustica rustica]
MREYTEKKETCGTICLKYLLFIFNFFFWLAGGAVMAVGIWTLAEKSDYISLLSSSTYSATAYILVVAGVVVMVTGILGCCATFKERRNLLRVYFILLLCIFLLEIIAGILAYIYYQQLSLELKQNLKNTMTQKYRREGEESVTSAVDKLQQEFKCCGSNNYTDWADSLWIKSPEASGRKVPDSCCKTITDLCGRRDHPSNIYKEIENFLLVPVQAVPSSTEPQSQLHLFSSACNRCIIQKLLNQIHMGEEHSAAAVSLQAKGIQGISINEQQLKNITDEGQECWNIKSPCAVFFVIGMPQSACALRTPMVISNVHEQVKPQLKESLFYEMRGARQEIKNKKGMMGSSDQYRVLSRAKHTGLPTVSQGTGSGYLEQLAEVIKNRSSFITPAIGISHCLSKFCLIAAFWYGYRESKVTAVGILLEVTFQVNFAYEDG